MENSLEKLHKIDTILAKLVDGYDLTAKESEELIYHIFVYDTDGEHFATWIGANHAKGETANELLGFLNATKRLSTQFNLKLDPNKTIGLSGSGGGSFKSINVSTTASFLVASAGYIVANEVYFAVTSPTGSADVFTSLGVNFQKLTKEQIENTLKEIGICPVITPFISPNLTNRGKLAFKYFVERQIRVRSPFHLVSNLQLPLPMNFRIYGCYSHQYLEILASLFFKMGYKKSLTFYADIGMPEISNVGKTTIVEQNDSKIKKYTIRPSDLGVREAKANDIKTGGREQNIVDFINILKGKEKGAKADLVAVNAGAALYVLNDVKTLGEGTEKAQQLLCEGEGYRKLEQLIGKIGNDKLLNNFI